MIVFVAHWEEQRHNSKFDKMDLSIATGKIAISFRVFQQKRHSCIFKTDRERAKKKS